MKNKFLLTLSVLSTAVALSACGSNTSDVSVENTETEIVSTESTETESTENVDTETESTQTAEAETESIQTTDTEVESTQTAEAEAESTQTTEVLNDEEGLAELEEEAKANGENIAANAAGYDVPDDEDAMDTDDDSDTDSDNSSGEYAPVTNADGEVVGRHDLTNDDWDWSALEESGLDLSY